jgi:hypothetical protein
VYHIVSLKKNVEKEQEKKPDFFRLTSTNFVSSSNSNNMYLKIVTLLLVWIGVACGASWEFTGEVYNFTFMLK